jgi:hypothetical protein
MALDIGTALRDGFDRTTARNGLLLAAVFVGFRLLNEVVQQSFLLVQFETSVDPAELAATPSFQEAGITAEDIRRTVADATPLAALDSLSAAQLLGVIVLLAVVAEALRIVAIRVFVSVETDSIPPELVARNLIPAVANGIVGGIVVGLLVAVGLALLIIPGIFLAVAFLFLRQEIAVEDRNFIEAISGSWNLTAGSRIELFVLVAFLVLLAFFVPSLVGAVGGPVVGSVVSAAGGPVVGSVVSAAAAGLVLTYGVATVSQAYNQLRTEREVAAAAAGGRPAAEDDAAEDDDPLSDIDDELLP